MLVHCNFNLLNLSLNHISGGGVSLCGPYVLLPVNQAEDGRVGAYM